MDHLTKGTQALLIDNLYLVSIVLPILLALFFILLVFRCLSELEEVFWMSQSEDLLESVDTMGIQIFIGD
jgi:uncharacterized RDD family membrane protein YckC